MTEEIMHECRCGERYPVERVSCPECWRPKDCDFPECFCDPEEGCRADGFPTP